MSVTAAPPDTPDTYDWRDKPTDAGYVSVYNQLVSLREKAELAPLRASTVEFALDLRIPPQNPHAAARPVLKASSTVTLQLDTLLQPGLNRFSEVWKTSVIGFPGTPLVMKIIQPSLCYIPDPDEAFWVGDYLDPYDLAHNEAWVYQKLANRQGLSIPYFYGVFDIVTPSGESAWALVLEFIPGLTIHGAAKFDTTDGLHTFCKLGLEAVKDLALSGWTLRNIDCSNFIRVSSSDSGTVVMIDLYGAELHGSAPCGRLAMMAAKHFYHGFAKCVSDDYPDFRDWAKQNLPEVVWNYGYDPDASQASE